ncbi:MAG: biopolymer transporter ExbD [Pseudomonadota bacterium]
MAGRLTSRAPRKKAEPTIALINIVFLMLIFFLIAGTLAAPIDRDLSLVKLSSLDGKEPPDALLIFSDKRLSFRGTDTTIDDHLSYRRDEAIDSAFEEDENALIVRIVPDKELPARDLVALSNELRSKGAARVVVVTERGL